MGVSLRSTSSCTSGPPFSTRARSTCVQRASTASASQFCSAEQGERAAWDAYACVSLWPATPNNKGLCIMACSAAYNTITACGKEKKRKDCEHRRWPYTTPPGAPAKCYALLGAGSSMGCASTPPASCVHLRPWQCGRRKGDAACEQLQQRTNCTTLLHQHLPFTGTTCSHSMFAWLDC